jgi:hypothetical protein
MLIEAFHKRIPITDSCLHGSFSAIHPLRFSIRGSSPSYARYDGISVSLVYASGSIRKSNRHCLFVMTLRLVRRIMFEKARHLRS